MKLDLNKPWIMHLVNQNSTVNGCSFIRGVILRTIWTAFLWVAGVTIAAFLAMALIGGAYMWFTDPSYFLDSTDRSTYFGTDWVAQTWAVMVFGGGILWAFAIGAGALVGTIYCIVKGSIKVSPVIGVAVEKTWNAVSLPSNFKEAVGAWYHKFCPQIEFILPKGYEGYVVGARVSQLSYKWDDEGEELDPVWVEGTIKNATMKGSWLELDVLWDATRDILIAHYAEPSTIEQYDSPELAQKGLERMLKSRVDNRRLWFTNDNSDFKLVEEISSPA